MLDDEKTIRRVMAEEGIGVENSDRELAKATEKRLAELGCLVREGLLGKYASGGHFHGYVVEGLRTELPFYYVNKVKFSDLYRTGFSVDGPVALSQVDHVDIVFDGRADLVLELRDDEGRGFLQVVDLKTKGCRDAFNPEDPTKGSALQRFDGDILNPQPSTHAEVSILEQHKLQLTLYSLALESMEQQKPESERRTVLPPSLLMGASGRILQMSTSEYDQAKATFSQHLEWMAQLSATPGTISEPPAVDKDNNHICSSCPFSRGDIRLCVSGDETLGPHSNDE